MKIILIITMILLLQPFRGFSQIESLQIDRIVKESGDQQSLEGTILMAVNGEVIYDPQNH